MKEGDQQVETAVKVKEMAMHARKGDGACGFWPWQRDRRKVEPQVAATVAGWRVARPELVVGAGRRCFPM